MINRIAIVYHRVRTDLLRISRDQVRRQSNDYETLHNLNHQLHPFQPCS
jgi:hypothetical protein